MFPEKQNMLNRFYDRFISWYNKNYHDNRIFAVIGRTNDTLVTGYYDVDNMTITDNNLKSTFDVNKVYYFYGRPSIFCIEGIRPSVDFKSWSDCLNNKTKLASSDKEAFNKMNNKDVSEMIKAIKNADYMLYGVIIAAGASVICLLFLAGFIDGGKLGDIMKQSTEILNRITVEVVKK